MSGIAGVHSPHRARIESTTVRAQCRLVILRSFAEDGRPFRGDAVIHECPFVRNTLSMLYDHDLVSVMADGIQRFYQLTDAASVKISSGFEEQTLQASDGSSIALKARIERAA